MKQPQQKFRPGFSLMKGFVVFILAVALAGIGLKAETGAQPPLMKVTLKPGPVNEAGLIGHIDVSIALPSADAPAGEPLLAMPAVYVGIETAAKTMTDFEAADAAGPLPMETKDDPAGGPVYYRKWIPSRPVKGDLLVRYRAPIDPRPQTRSEVPIVLRSEDGGFHGGGTVFLLSPTASKRYGLAIRWDLVALGPQARGSSSFGDNDVEIAEAGASSWIGNAFFMAGPMSRYPEKPEASGGFSAAWLTKPPFDPHTLMDWTKKLYDSYRAFFKTKGEKPYRVFMRTNRVNSGGGVGLFNSFVATFDDTTKAEDLKLLLAHEMLHTFAPGLGEESENGLDSTQWFHEGLAIYYQRLLPLRAGLIEPAVFLEDLNLTAGRYYTNLLNGTPNDQIAPRFWEDTRIRVLPYDRGSMYLAVVDSKIRKASGGKRSLDDLVLTLLDRGKKGLACTPETWVELVTKELGPSAKAEYEAMLAGAVMLPDPDAFGPEYERTVVPLRRFDLGFDPKVMIEKPSVIHGLVPGSAAEQAGLRDGDEILMAGTGLDTVQEGQKTTLTLKIRREGKDLSVTYLPRGETVDAWQWVRKTAAERIPVSAITEHAGTFNGQKINYTATVAETIIPDKDGKPAASMVTTTYIRKDVKNSLSRPVLFCFNGGPGASSTPLHLSAFGPRRWIEVNGQRSMGDNPLSPLDEIDLVFIDPVGTGFSRPLPGVDGQPFWSITGDAESVAYFIKSWLKIHGRESSPRFLCGESYGTTRAAQIIGFSQDLKFNGVILISMMADSENPDLPYVLEFPTFAAVAAFHGKVDAAGRTPDDIFREALEFARDEYLPALIQGGALPDEEKARLAGEMARRIGLPAAFISGLDLRVTPQDFMLTLLADRGLRTGQIDARVTGKLEDFAGQEPPGDDPSMAGPKAAPGSAVPKPEARSATQIYFEEELKFPAKEKYNALNLAINAKWKFDTEKTMGDPAGVVARAMREQLQLRLFWAAGYYDITTPLFAGKYILEHSGAPIDRLTIAAFPTGHMVYEGDENLGRFVKSIKEFTGKAGAGAPAAVKVPDAPVFEIQLRPVRGADGEPEAVEVRERISGGERPKDAGPLSFKAPTLYAGVSGIADTIENLEIRDAIGPVSLAKTDDPTDKGGYVFFRHWRAERAVMYPFEVSYRARMYPTTKRNGPPWHLRPTAGGVSAAGVGFLLLPEDPGEYQIRLHWDLSGMAPNSIGVMSLGEGDVKLTGTADQLLNAWYMAGPVGRYPARGDVAGFSATWLGDFPFDPIASMKFASDAYQAMKTFFRDTNPDAYRVFMRALKTPPFGGGTALPRSFMLSQSTAPRDPADSGPRETIVHEMMHDFTGGIEGPEGITAWFSEGLTAYYTAKVPLRAGLSSIESFLQEINERAKSYYTNPGKNMSAEEIAKVGFGDERIRHVPYARGFLYFADCDARIREASGGKRKLDDVILEFFARRKAGEKIDQETWLDVMTKEIGPSARADFEEKVLGGKTIVPASGAFGPGFERKAVTYTEDGKEIDGFEWVRVPSVTDAQCREW